MLTVTPIRWIRFNTYSMEIRFAATRISGHWIATNFIQATTEQVSCHVQDRLFCYNLNASTVYRNSHRISIKIENSWNGLHEQYHRTSLSRWGSSHDKLNNLLSSWNDLQLILAYFANAHNSLMFHMHLHIHESRKMHLVYMKCCDINRIWQNTGMLPCMTPFVQVVRASYDFSVQDHSVQLFASIFRFWVLIFKYWDIFVDGVCTNK